MAGGFRFGLKPKAMALDPLRGDAPAQAAMKAAARGDLQPFEALVHSSPERTILFNLLSSHGVAGTPQLQAWADERPSSVRLTALGSQLIQDAWNIRGSGRASSVHEGAWDPFHDGLRHADQVLQNAAAADPTDGSPWAFLTTTARGLSMGKTELLRRFSEGHQRTPFDTGLCEVTLQGVCAKWSGSKDAMFEWARWVDTNAPAGSGACGVLPRAHLEQALDERDRQPLEDYLRRPDVNQEITRSLERWLPAVTRPTGAQVGALNAYACALFPIDVASARAVQQVWPMLGNTVIESPWFYFDHRNPGQAAAIRRADTLRAARKF